MADRLLRRARAGSGNPAGSSAETPVQATGARPRNQGLGRILVAVYGVFALSALARSGYQIASHFEQAPLAYLLSAFSAVVYLVATISLARTGRRAWLVSLVAVLVELVGVVGIGAWTLLDPQLFGDETVWSRFGAGYGYIPLLLPVIGLVWLFTHRAEKA